MKQLLGIACLLSLVGIETRSVRGVVEKPYPPPALPKPWKEIKEKVDRVVISPDGKLIATMREAPDGDAVLYDRETGKELRRVASKLYCSAQLFTFTPDSKRLIMHRCRDNELGAEAYDVLIWEVGTGKLLRHFPLAKLQGAYQIYTGQYVVTNDLLIVAGQKEFATAYNLRTGKAIGSFPGNHRSTMLSLSRDGYWLLSAGTDNTLCLWDVRKLLLIHKLCHHTEPVAGIAISSDGKWCASITEDNQLWIFDRIKGKQQARTNSFFRSYSQLKFTPDGNKLIATGIGVHYGLLVWDWRVSREMRGGYPSDPHELRGEDGKPKKKWNWNAIGEFSMADDGTFLTNGPGRNIYLWELKGLAPAKTSDTKK